MVVMGMGGVCGVMMGGYGRGGRGVMLMLQHLVRGHTGHGLVMMWVMRVDRCRVHLMLSRVMQSLRSYCESGYVLEAAYPGYGRHGRQGGPRGLCHCTHARHVAASSSDSSSCTHRKVLYTRAYWQAIRRQCHGGRYCHLKTQHNISAIWNMRHNLLEIINIQHNILELWNIQHNILET